MSGETLVDRFQIARGKLKELPVLEIKQIEATNCKYMSTYLHLKSAKRKTRRKK